MTEQRWTTGERYVVDAASRENDGRYTRYVAAQARATTLRLVPRSEAGA